MNGTQRLITCVALFLACVTAVRGYIDDDTGDTDGKCEVKDSEKKFCRDCLHYVICPEVPANTLPPTDFIKCTIPGEACEIVADQPACVPLDKSTCSCNGPSQCDAWDLNGSVLICAGPNPIAVEHCDTAAGEKCSTVTHQCEVGTTTPSPSEQCAGEEDGWHMIPTDCSTGVYCRGDTSLGITECKENEYFDETSNSCKPAPPVACPDGLKGPSPDLADCSQYFICENGIILDTEQCNNATFYDPSKESCSADSVENLPCNDFKECGFSSGSTTPSVSTTTSVSTTPSVSITPSVSETTAGATTTSGVDPKPAECNASTVGIYPDPANCKRYWSCVLSSNAGYIFVHGNCLGTLLYNPATELCDYPKNIATWNCIPPPVAVY